MRVYRELQLEQMYCNRCGKKISLENGIVKEGILTVEQQWGYFSGKDGKRHSFDLCEECYDEIVKNFKHPVEEQEYTELL